MTTDPVNNSKVTRRGTTTRDTNKGIKGNRTYKKARNIQFDSIIKKKGQIVIVRATLVTAMKIGEVLHQTNVS